MRRLLVVLLAAALPGGASPALAQRPVFAEPSDSSLPLCRNVRGNRPCIGDRTIIYPARDYQPPPCVDGAGGIPCGGEILRLDMAEPRARWQRPLGQRLDYFLIPPGETDSFVERSIARDLALLGAPRDIDQPTLGNPDHYQVRYLIYGGPNRITIAYFWTPARTGGGLVCRHSYRERDLDQNRSLISRCWPMLEEAQKRARDAAGGHRPLPSPAN